MDRDGTRKKEDRRAGGWSTGMETESVCVICLREVEDGGRRPVFPWMWRKRADCRCGGVAVVDLPKDRVVAWREHLEEKERWRRERGEGGKEDRRQETGDRSPIAQLETGDAERGDTEGAERAERREAVRRIKERVFGKNNVK